MSEMPKQLQRSERQKIGPIQGSPVTTSPDLSALTPHERALRLAVIQEFKARKVRKFVERQVEHINTSKRAAEAIRYLFDEQDRPPANVPLEDIVGERRHVEYQLRWIEAIALELQNKLVRIKELEAYALDLLETRHPEDEHR